MRVSKSRLAIKKRSLLFSLVLGQLLAFSMPASAAAVDQKIVDTITSKLESARRGMKVKSVEPSKIKGIYNVKVTDGPQLYVDETGSFFVAGDLYQITPRGFVNLAEQDRDGDRAQLMAQLDPKEMIVFPAKEKKATITVFTDVDCFYCQKLHKEVPEMNKLGIEVRYLAYPRAGIGSASYKKIASAWCADNPNEALTKLKNKQNIPENVCADNPVAAQFNLGKKVGVTGTPAMVMENGRLLPGYMPADRLAKALGI